MNHTHKLEQTEVAVAVHIQDHMGKYSTFPFEDIVTGQ
jgi:hypothetical protein